jgi:hypothetical protein
MEEENKAVSEERVNEQFERRTNNAKQNNS